MIYRKAPPQPGRLLLRVVAGAGAVALAGAVACCSDDGPNGVAPIPPRDGGPDAYVGGGSSSGGGFDASGSSSGGFDASGFVGFTDSGEGDAITEAAPGCDGCGIVVNPDASIDAPLDVVTGVVVHPDGGGD